MQLRRSSLVAAFALAALALLTVATAKVAPAAEPVPSPAAAPAPSPAATPAPHVDLVRIVRGKLSAADLASGAAYAEDWKREYGIDATYLDAVGWLARGAVMLGQPDAALAYAREVRAAIPEPVVAERLGALGAAIEAESQVRAAREGSAAAVAFLTGELRLSEDVAFRSRLWKNINRLELVGKPAPELGPPTAAMDPAPPSLAALRGKPVLLFFWAHWCGDCRAQAAALTRLRERWRDQISFLMPTRLYGTARDGAAATPDEESAHIAAVIAADYPGLAGIPVTIDTATMVRYGVSATPTFVLVDRAGKVRLYAPTRLTEAELDRRLAELVAEARP
jgi:thiol-disulfide isomerase/thioredoxin